MRHQKLYFQVEDYYHRRRLDEFLFDKFDSLSKMYLREIVKTGKCEVNGYSINVGSKIRANDFIEIEVDLTRETAMRPEDFPLEIVYEEADFLLVNKPTEMLVHPTHRDKNGTLLNALSFYLNRKNADSGVNTDKFSKTNVVRPGLIHRLDKKTSGLILIAKNVPAHRLLSDSFQYRRVEKKYYALVEGVVEENSGVIIQPIGRFVENKNWNVKADGKFSETHFRVRERFADSTLLEMQPVTGRTNQLRIHCAHIGHPIVGDDKYGGRAFQRLCLHAYKLTFEHPKTHQQMEFEIDLPEDFSPN